MTGNSWVKLDRLMSNLNLIFPMSSWEKCLPCWAVPCYLWGVKSIYSPTLTWNVFLFLSSDLLPLLRITLLHPVSNFTFLGNFAQSSQLSQVYCQARPLVLLHCKLITMANEWCVGSFLCSIFPLHGSPRQSCSVLDCMLALSHTVSHLFSFSPPAHNRHSTNTY
jgi:hypothetical protein